MKAELLQRRSQRRLHNKLAGAITKRERLLQEDALSVPRELGYLVIVVSGRATYPTAYDPGAKKEQYEARLEEAERLKEQHLHEYDQVLIKGRALKHDIQFSIADPRVSSMIFMGHGTINCLMLEEETSYLTWHDVSKATTHLKQGAIEQRTCGHFPEDIPYSVPFGTFAVASLSNLRAAVGRGVPLPNGDSRNHMFTPVYTADVPLMNQLDMLNEHKAATAPLAAAA